VTLVIISIETYCLMARCLKGECTVEEGEALADLLSANPDLRQEYEIFRHYFHHNSNKNKAHTTTTEQPGLQKKFERITRKLTDEGIL
jgi:GrpB-like predicted nucleotidyltransferase (UPF0157 family)